MTMLHGTKTYIWSLQEPIGEGASSKVYRGRHKKQGDLCAVKVFKRNGKFKEELWHDELKLLGRLRHQNIVKVYAIENELQTTEGSANPVLVMEICRTSVHGMLSEPPYMYGFPESEMLLIIKNTTSAIKYLRANNLIHRDIKPGNIMCVIGENGRNIYKLGDFGASKYVRDDETYYSLYGTEEYLHPHVHSAILQKSKVRAFNATMELWSVGVSFYHIATGMLPFRPYGGRQNPSILLQITSNKKPGMISGVQNDDDMDIKYTNKLPETCNLSQGFSSLLVDMLSGLMERRKDQSWDFKRLFDHVDNLEKMVTFKVFNQASMELLHIYAPYDCHYTKLQGLIHDQTDVPPENQILILLRGSELCDVVDDEIQVQDYPVSVVENTIFLLRRDGEHRFENDIKMHLPPMPYLISPMVYENDSKVSHKGCGYIHYLKAVAERMTEKQQLLVECIAAFSEYLTRAIDKTLNDITGEMRFANFINLQPHTDPQLLKLFPSGGLVKVHNYLNKLRSQIIPARFLNRFYKHGCLDKHDCAETLALLLELITKIWVRFRRDKQSTKTEMKLSYNDEQIHKMERISLKQKLQRGYEHVETHCFPNTDSCRDETSRIFLNLHKVYKCYTDANRQHKELIEKVDNFLRSSNQNQVESLKHTPPIITRGPTLTAPSIDKSHPDVLQPVKTPSIEKSTKLLMQDTFSRGARLEHSYQSYYYSS